MVTPAVTQATALFIQASLGFMAATMSVAFTDIAAFVTKIARMDCAESLRGSLRSFETPEFPPRSCWNKSHAKSVEIVQWDSFCEGERPDAVGALPQKSAKASSRTLPASQSPCPRKRSHLELGRNLGLCAVLESLLIACDNICAFDKEWFPVQAQSAKSPLCKLFLCPNGRASKPEALSWNRIQIC